MRKKQKQKAEDLGLGTPTPSVGASQSAKRITPVDIQQKEFRLAFRGYNERDVDAFLDEVTEELAGLHSENKRLREQLEFKGTAPISTAGASEADDIVRHAREEADRILSEARARAGAGAIAGSATEEEGKAGPRGVPPRLVNTLLARERTFLQELAERIQSHAQAVKDDVQVIRAAAVPGEAAPAGSDSPARATPTSAAPEEPPAADEEERTIEGRLAEAGESAGEPGEGSAGPGAEGLEAAGGPGAREADSEVWTPAFLKHDVAAGTPEPELSGHGPEQVVDLRGTDVEEPAEGRAAEVFSGIPSRPKPEEDEGEDRSLRELFWGEN